MAQTSNLALFGDMMIHMGTTIRDWNVAEATPRYSGLRGGALPPTTARNRARNRSRNRSRSQAARTTGVAASR